VSYDANDETLKTQGEEVAQAIAVKTGFVPFKFAGMSSSLKKRLRSWKLVFGGKSGGRAHYFQGVSRSVSPTHTPKTAAWKAKQRRKGKLARKARRVRRLHAA